MRLQNLMSTAIVLFATAGAPVACQEHAVQQPSYSISVHGAGNQVTSTSSGSDVLFEVRSETGLGSAYAEQTSGDPPEKIVIRLHLRGLEEFNFQYEQTTVIVSVSSHGDQAVSERMLIARSEETPVAPDSPYWMPVQLVKGAPSGSQNLPAYFEVQAPQDYVRGQHRAFSMRWIDFYR